ncbi:MAG: TlpA disulfide reductase family protein, partial [Cryomorphaceae bacterium]
LDHYDEPLPSWFKQHESWRLKYLSGFLTYNVLFSKEFYSGEKIAVSKDYYSFTNQLPLINQEMILNTEYLWYAQFHIGEQGKAVTTTEESDGQLVFIDSLYGDAESGDILKMKRLLDIYRVNKERFDFLFPKTTFKNDGNKEILDSLLKVKFGLPRMGQVLPKLSLTKPEGEEVSIEQYKGNFLMVNFWATWCGPCIAEFPRENEIHRLYKGKGLQIINVCVDSDRDQWKAVSKDKNLQTINLFSSGNYHSVSRDFDINGLPKSLLIDRDLKVVDNNFRRASSLNEDDLESIISGEWR